MQGHTKKWIIRRNWLDCVYCWVYEFSYTLCLNLGPFCQYQQLYLLKINFLFELSVSKKFLCSIADSKHCCTVIIYRYRDKIFKKFSTLLKNYKDNIIIKNCSLWTFCELLDEFYKIQLKISIYIMRRLCHKKSTFICI